MKKGDRVMVVKDNVPYFYTVDKVDDNYRGEECVWVKEREGYFLKTDIYHKKWIAEQLDIDLSNSNNMCPICEEEKELIYDIHFGEICRDCRTEFLKDLKGDKDV